ncbi:GMC family oxidoreductase N-terminal domain-containing protein, partial [Pseudomonas aeruginosa]
LAATALHAAVVHVGLGIGLVGPVVAPPLQREGKGLGGSSLINGMCYIRGNALDFDGWAKEPGLEDWSYIDCLPYFRKAETREIGPNDYHVDDDP